MQNKRRARVATFSLSPASRLFIIAFLIRITLVLVVPDLIPEAEDKLERYDAIALNLEAGNGFSIGNTPTAVAPPVYPTFLSVIYFFFGYSRTTARVFLALIDAGHCVVVYAIAKNLFAGSIPILAGTTLAFHPSFIALVFTGTSEAMFVFLNSLFIYSLYLAFYQHSARRYLVSGILLGITTLCRAVALLLPFFIMPAFLLLHEKNQKQAFSHFTIFILAFTLTVAPWIVRDYLIFNRFVPVQSYGGMHLYWATPEQGDSRDRSTERIKTQGMDEIGKDYYYYAQAWERIRQAPLEYFRGMCRRFVKMWYKTHSGTYDTVLLFLNGGLLLLGIAGIVRTHRRWKELSLLSSVMAYYVILHMIVIALARYLLPIIPILTIFAMIPIADVFKRRASPKTVGQTRSANFTASSFIDPPCS